MFKRMRVFASLSHKWKERGIFDGLTSPPHPLFSLLVPRHTKTASSHFGPRCFHWLLLLLLLQRRFKPRISGIDSNDTGLSFQNFPCYDSIPLFLFAMINFYGGKQGASEHSVRRRGFKDKAKTLLFLWGKRKNWAAHTVKNLSPRSVSSLTEDHARIQWFTSSSPSPRFLLRWCYSQRVMSHCLEREGSCSAKCAIYF